METPQDQPAVSDQLANSSSCWTELIVWEEMISQAVSRVHTFRRAGIKSNLDQLSRHSDTCLSTRYILVHLRLRA